MEEKVLSGGISFLLSLVLPGPPFWGGSLSPGDRVLQLGFMGVTALQCLFSDGRCVSPF